MINWFIELMYTPMRDLNVIQWAVVVLLVLLIVWAGMLIKRPVRG